MILSVCHLSSIVPLHKQKLPHVGQAITRFISTTNYYFQFYPLLIHNRSVFSKDQRAMGEFLLKKKTIPNFEDSPLGKTCVQGFFKS